MIFIENIRYFLKDESDLALIFESLVYQKHFFFLLLFLYERQNINKKLPFKTQFYAQILQYCFLGRVYTSNTKTVFNASLKSRIDEFVTQNKIEIHSGYKNIFIILILIVFVVIAVKIL